MEPQGRVAAAPLRSGDPAMVGTYRLSGRIGEGGMGTVYLGEAPSGRAVAVKVVRAELAGNRAFLARFRDEVGNAQRVASFCTAQVLDHGEIDGRAYMVTEYIDGPSLAAYVRTNGALSAGMLHGFAVGVSAALVAIHAAGLVHRDLKARNVLLSMSGPRVIDFGIARALDVASGHTKTGQVIGTPGWIAPEQIQYGEVTTAADVFAWGCLITYAGTGRHPFGEGDFTVMVARVLHAEPDVGPLPPVLDPLVRAALDKDPRRRPSARDLLLGLIDGQGSGDAAVRSNLSHTWSPPPVPVPPVFPPPEPVPPESVLPQAVPGSAPRPESGPPQSVSPGRNPLGQIPPLPIPLESASSIPEPPATQPPATQPPATQPSAAEPPVTEPAVTAPAVTAPGVTTARESGPRRRPGVLVTGVASVAVAAAVAGGFALKATLGGQPSDRSSVSRQPPQRAAHATPGVTMPTGLPADLNTDPMLVRLDRAPGWPRHCHGSIAVFTPGSPAAPRVLVPGTHCDMLPRWSPDRQRIAYTRVSGSGSELWVMNKDGSKPQRVASVKGRGRVAWSPDGKRLAYVDSVGRNREIFVLTLGSSGPPQRITDSPATEDDPAWSHDGKRIAFWSDKGGTRQIYTLLLDDPARWTKVTKAPHGAADPEWSPNDRFIVYTRDGADQNSDIWVAEADGHSDRQLTSDPAHEMDPGWSRGGRWIIFVRGPTATPRVYVMRADGGADARPLTPVSPAMGHPNWSA